jgi:hypothetical protein
MPAWTTRKDVETGLHRKWRTGRFLTALATGEPWTPMGIPLRGPSAREIAADLAAAQHWVRTWHRSDGSGIRLEHASVGGRLFGVNQIPSRAWIDSYADLWRVLGVGDEVTRFAGMLAYTNTAAPRLVDWLARHPIKALGFAADWTAICRTVVWIDRDRRPDMYLRQVDVPGVDTKFIERHRGLLAELLDRQLDAERINADHPPADFAARYGFLDKPKYVRLRSLDGVLRPFGHCTELSVRADELAVAAPEAATVYIIENEITYLAFPPAPDSVAIFGGGYGLGTLQALDWLADRELVYWGDIDTHGFAILDRLRGRFGNVRSMLMDRETLLAHRTQWVREATPSRADLDHLTADEAELHRDLIRATFGESIRLEQERIRFSAVLHAFRP